MQYDRVILWVPRVAPDNQHISSLSLFLTPLFSKTLICNGHYLIKSQIKTKPIPYQNQLQIMSSSSYLWTDNCKCGRPLMVVTTWTTYNPARRFVCCQNRRVSIQDLLY